jgi:hypothetical protein
MILGVDMFFTVKIGSLKIINFSPALTIACLPLLLMNDADYAKSVLKVTMIKGFFFFWSLIVL